MPPFLDFCLVTQPYGTINALQFVLPTFVNDVYVYTYTLSHHMFVLIQGGNVFGHQVQGVSTCYQKQHL